jgi:hypothetical protein
MTAAIRARHHCPNVSNDETITGTRERGPPRSTNKAAMGKNFSVLARTYELAMKGAMAWKWAMSMLAGNWLKHGMHGF